MWHPGTRDHDHRADPAGRASGSADSGRRGAAPQGAGGFLRSRRERLSPDQLGLPEYGRRRTPGLRREEVAQHAGVGVTWYTWLEQARDINVSEQVLDAIARTLLLDPHERGHLFTLAGSPLTEIGPGLHAGLRRGPAAAGQAPPVPGDACPTGGTTCSPTTGPTPRWSATSTQVPFDQRNTLWLLFTSPTMRASLPDWDSAMRRMVGQYRAAMADHVGEPVWKCLVQAAAGGLAGVRRDVAAARHRLRRRTSPSASTTRSSAGCSSATRTCGSRPGPAYGWSPTRRPTRRPRRCSRGSTTWIRARSRCWADPPPSATLWPFDRGSEGT